jgi:hypothetical protein
MSGIVPMTSLLKMFKKNLGLQEQGQFAQVFKKFGLTQVNLPYL